MSEIRTVVVSVDELKEIVSSMLRVELANIVGPMLDEKLNIAKEASEDLPLKGGRQISSYMNYSETYFYKRFRDDMLDKKCIYYVGRTLYSTTGKVREYMDSFDQI